MTYFLLIDSFFFKLFPDLKDVINDHQRIITGVSEHFRAIGINANVRMTNDDLIQIDLSSNISTEDEKQFKKVTSLCERQKYDSATAELNSLIAKNPSISEYYRVRGQIQSETGNDDEAINDLIEALRLDPNNSWALIMMGNIFARNKKDLETAMIYYNRVLEVDSNNHIALNNIAATLYESGDTAKAEQYFLSSRRVDPTYPNSIYGLLKIYKDKGDSKAAFELSIELMKLIDTSSPFYSDAVKSSQNAASMLIDKDVLSRLIRETSVELEKSSGKPVRVESDDSIEFPAKLELAEVYNRPYHLVKFKPGNVGVQHLVMHELMHLHFATQAREAGCNLLFTSTKSMMAEFKKSNQKTLSKLRNDMKVTDEALNGFAASLFNGINSQMYNTPIDLFIEKKLHDDYPDLRSVQYLSLLSLEQDYIAGATNKQVAKYTSQVVRDANMVLSLVNTLQFRDLYGLDLVGMFQAPTRLVKMASELYEEWKEYAADKEPGEEYELIQDWAGYLKIDSYFRLVDEKPVNNISNFSAEPINLVKNDTDDLSRFEAASGKAKNALVAFLEDALRHFDSISSNDVKQIGFEIGMLGQSGIDPNDNEKVYRLKTVEGRQFVGLELLAWMYASFKEIDPKLDTGLDFQDEYIEARRNVAHG
jgi:tetratricopeptide (TPR) repeat protein